MRRNSEDQRTDRQKKRIELFVNSSPAVRMFMLQSFSGSIAALMSLIPIPLSFIRFALLRMTRSRLWGMDV
jgi:hypothetical protein